MTDQHPITPPSELLEQWQEDIELKGRIHFDHVLNSVWQNGVQAGADAELEACCDVIARELICAGEHLTGDLRAVRRPKPSSLKEQALTTLKFIACVITTDQHDIIRHALESLPY